MAIIVNVDDDKQLTLYTIIGNISVEDLMTALKRFYEDRPTTNVLWDFTNASGTPPSSQEKDAIFDFIKKHSNKRSRGNIAVIAPQNLGDKMSKMVQEGTMELNLPLQIETFQSIEEALQWFGED